MTADFELRGSRRLRQTAVELPAKVRRRIARRANRRGAVVLRDAIRRRAPVRSEGGRKRITGGTEAKGTRRRGFGRRNVRLWERRQKGARRDVFRHGVAPSRRAFYLAFYEFGTSRQPARPFIRPAVQEAEQAAFNAVVDALEDGINAELTRLGWK